MANPVEATATATSTAIKVQRRTAIPRSPRERPKNGSRKQEFGRVISRRPGALLGGALPGLSSALAGVLPSAPGALPFGLHGPSGAPPYGLRDPPDALPSEPRGPAVAPRGGPDALPFAAVPFLGMTCNSPSKSYGVCAARMCLRTQPNSQLSCGLRPLWTGCRTSRDVGLQTRIPVAVSDNGTSDPKDGHIRERPARLEQRRGSLQSEVWQRYSRLRPGWREACSWSGRSCVRTTHVPRRGDGRLMVGTGT